MFGDVGLPELLVTKLLRGNVDVVSQLGQGGTLIVTIPYEEKGF